MPTTRPRILCVEDDADTCELLSLLLGRANYEVTCAPTLAEGLSLARGRGFDLYLLDQWLPDGTGTELCLELRRFDRRTPVLFFSAQAREYDSRQALAVGAQAYLIKPHDIGVLASTVARLLAEAEERVNA